ncbi:caspase domain-containing protein [Mycena leptocephala]|nr:caspase domain-containing protein [Mycena leptocephala]
MSTERQCWAVLSLVLPFRHVSFSLLIYTLCPPMRKRCEIAQTSKNIFALIIGINDYIADGFLPLHGSVNDARAFEEYLLDPYDKRGLQVPSSNIVLIVNKKATRAAIMDAFKSHFLENENIPDRGEATMILFFAGHGGATGNGKVQTIYPVDVRTTNAAGEYVHAIPNYVLGWLLCELAEKKGPNITVILDCCHSGPCLAFMPRSSVVLTFTTGGMGGRAATDWHHIPPELDSHLWKGKTESAQSYHMWSPFTESWVLLAACRADEIAREIEYRGVRRGRFTECLIRLLRWASLTTTTYTELMDRMEEWWDDPNQHPHCGGRTNRLIFDGNCPATGRGLPLTVQDVPKGSPTIPNSSQFFSVAMGVMEGVVPGTEFSAYDANNNFLCTFVAQSVEVAHTNVVAKMERDQPSVLIPHGSRAVVSDWKNDVMVLCVHTPADFRHTAHLFPKISNTGRMPRFVAASPEGAHFIVRCEEAEIVIEPCKDTTIRKAQPEMRFPLGNPAHLPDAMDGVAHFNYFLERSNKKDPLMGGFSLEMHRLLGEYPARYPDTSVGQNGNMVIDGAVRFASEEGARYGFTMRNMSYEDLYPYLFYFNPETFIIQYWYLPEDSRVAPPLQSGRSLTLGMGGERAFEFTLKKDQKESSGFLKLFVARKFVDLKWIKQSMSPFDAEFVGVGQRLSPFDAVVGVARREMTRQLNDSPWDALTVLLTMTQ